MQLEYGPNVNATSHERVANITNRSHRRGVWHERGAGGRGSRCRSGLNLAREPWRCSAETVERTILLDRVCCGGSQPMLLEGALRENERRQVLDPSSMRRQVIAHQIALWAARRAG